MKKYFKEIIICIMQIVMFYFWPKMIGNIGAIQMVVTIMMTTLILSFILGCFSKGILRYIYPVVVSALFLPTVPIYYNETAYIHAIWYFILSVIGIMTGFLIRKILRQ